MLDRHPTTPPTPEEMLDSWLDTLNEPDRIGFPVPSAEIWNIADVALRYRRAFATTPAPSVARTAITERNGSMNHVLPLTTSNPAAWRTVRPARQKRRNRGAGWIGWLSNGLATAMVIGLLLALSGAMIVQQTGLPGGADDPTAMPGMAASPQATPAGDALSCASPGYRAVVEGDVNPDTLAMIGETEPSIVIGNGEITVPLADGGERSVPKGEFATLDPGVVVTHYEDNSSTVTRQADGKSWDFPAVQPGRYDSGTITGNGRYYVAPTDDTLTNWFVLDVRTGERTTTADILGEPFEGPTNSFSGRRFLGQPQSSNDLSTFVISFEEIVEDSEEIAFRAITPGTLVIPGSIDDAYFDDFLPDTTVSPGGSFLASFNNIIDARTGETFFGVDTDDFRGYVAGPFIAFIDDEPTILAHVDDEVRSVHPSTGGYDVVYEADAPIQAVGYDQAANSLVVGSGQPGAEEWTWLDLDTGENMSLPELDGYQLNRINPVIPIDSVRHLDGIADFIQSDRPNRPAEPVQIAEYSVRALDMETGVVSTAVTNELPADREFSGGYLPTITDDGFVATQDPSGSFKILLPGTGARIMMPKPANVDLGTATYLSLSGTPNQSCLMLNVYDEQFEQVHNTYVAPLEPGATWTELDVRIRQWVEIPDDASTETLPAQEIGSPVATPID